jgi:Na+/melibiose symporter-like transporter
MEAFTPLGFLLRLLAAIVLVLCTFNPSGYSYVHWVADVFPHITPVQAIVGIVLLVGWIIYLTATMRSIGFLGVGLALAFFAAVVWLIASWGWLDPHNATAMTWVVLFVCSAILAVGISWSHIRRRLTGQSDVDEVEQSK